MNKALLFAGQGAQFVGMGHDLYQSSMHARKIFEDANDILGYRITDMMFDGPEENLKRTVVTQPALFIHSMAYLASNEVFEHVKYVAGHSLGECTALAAAGVFSFEEGLVLVNHRATTMQEACDNNPGTMAAIVGLEDEVVEQICGSISDIVVPANYNCPGQLVISGSIEGIEEGIHMCKEHGAKRAIQLNVAGAFHSPLMLSARDSFEDVVRSLDFKQPIFPIVQNVSALPVTDAATLKENLISQITAPVRWSQGVVAMIENGVDTIREIGGTAKVLSGLMRRIDREILIERDEVS